VVASGRGHSLHLQAFASTEIDSLTAANLKIESKWQRVIHLEIDLVDDPLLEAGDGGSQTVTPGGSARMLY